VFFLPFPVPLRSFLLTQRVSGYSWFPLNHWEGYLLDLARFDLFHVCWIDPVRSCKKKLVTRLVKNAAFLFKQTNKKMTHLYIVFQPQLTS